MLWVQLCCIWTEIADHQRKPSVFHGKARETVLYCLVSFLRELSLTLWDCRPVSQHWSWLTPLVLAPFPALQLSEHFLWVPLPILQSDHPFYVDCPGKWRETRWRRLVWNDSLLINQVLRQAKCAPPYQGATAGKLSSHKGKKDEGMQE